jgi:hypothetical protein
MKDYTLFILNFLVFSLISCANSPDLAKAKTYKSTKPHTEIAIWSRITFYHNKEDGWGDKVAACPKMRNKPGFGVAAHPDFKFYTNIRIPILKGKLDGDDKFQVIDRGGAVTKSKAFKEEGIGGVKSNKLSSKGYVFDVYVPRNRYREFIKNTPQYAWVIVEQ